MRPLLGDFLAAASEYINAATSDAPQPPAATRAVVRELAHLTAVMARCADAFVLDDGIDPPGAQALAVLEAGSALRHAGGRTRTAAAALGDGDDDARHLAAASLASATAHLAAGHDLLQSHFTPEHSGARYGTSLWAPVIVSAPANAALVTAIAGYAGRLAPWMIQLAATPSGTLPASARVALSAAGRWLRIAEAAAWATGGQPDTAAEQALLHAIPANIPPSRRSPHGDEQVPEVCAGIIATAERLRHLVHCPAPRPDTARTGLAVTWLRTAQGAAIIGHCSELILHQLANDATQLPRAQIAREALKRAAHEIGGTWAAWRAVAHKWDLFTTNPGDPLTPIATAIGDLTLWTGRLAYTDPAWTPARTNTSPVRTTSDLASTSDTIAAVVAALHQAGDALAHTAAHDRETIRQTAADRDLYVSIRFLAPKRDLPYRYLPALPAMTDALLSTYDVLIQTATRAVTALDDLALTLDPQPTIFATLRTIAPLTTAYRPDTPAMISGYSVPPPRPGRTEHVLRRRGINEPMLLARAADIDDATQDLLTATMSPSQRQAAADWAALQPPVGRSAHRQHPAELAKKDEPPYTGGDTPLPRLVPINHPIRHRTARRHQ